MIPTHERALKTEDQLEMTTARLLSGAIGQRQTKGLSLPRYRKEPAVR
jgi:hypothetical protein